MALDHYNIPSKESSEFQLWVLFKDGAYPLIGHEFPFAIQMSQHREFSVIDDADITPDTDALTPPSTEQVNNEGQLRFFLKRSRKLHNKVVSSRRWIRKPIPWKIHKKNSGSKSSSYDIIISTGKVFGLPLDQLTSDDELVPKPISDLLVRLFRYGPSTSGVFRKTPNQREVKELKEEIDEEKEVNLEETSVHVTAGLMKEFLRRLPDAVCCCDYYEDFLSSNDIEDQAERIQEIKRLLEKLPACNLELIKRFVCVLYHISQNSENNNMTSFNLGVCVAPSMLWPPTSVKAETPEQAKSTAPQFVEFIIDHFPEIFGDDAVDVLGNKSEIVVDVPVICENGELEPREISGETRTRSASLHHSDSNLYQVKNNEDNSGHMGTLLTVKDDRKPLSQSTPNSPTHQRKTMDKNLSPNDISRKIHSAFYHPKYSPRNVKRSLDQTTTNSDTSLSRKLDDVPGNKRPIILTSSTTSAELIEHIPDENGNPKRKSASTSCLTAGNGPEPAVLRKTLLPKREGILQFASSQSFYTAPSCVAERAHCVDRRRQPAAPSYQEHMQRQRPSLRLQIPSSTPRTSNQNEVPTGNKSTETKIGLALTPSSEKMREALTADPYLFMRLSPGSSHVSPVSSELSAPSKPSTGSETSISSLSSNDECLDTEITSATEDKPDVTQLKSIRDLLDVSGYANPLRISPETKDMINRTRGEWGHQINDDCADMDDFQRMTMAEETYV